MNLEIISHIIQYLATNCPNQVLHHLMNPNFHLHDIRKDAKMPLKLKSSFLGWGQAFSSSNPTLYTYFIEFRIIPLGLTFLHTE